MEENKEDIDSIGKRRIRNSFIPIIDFNKKVTKKPAVNELKNKLKLKGLCGNDFRVTESLVL